MTLATVPILGNKQHTSYDENGHLTQELCDVSHDWAKDEDLWSNVVQI